MQGIVGASPAARYRLQQKATDCSDQEFADWDQENMYFTETDPCEMFKGSVYHVVSYTQLDDFYSDPPRAREQAVKQAIQLEFFHPPLVKNTALSSSAFKSVTLPDALEVIHPGQGRIVTPLTVVEPFEDPAPVGQYFTPVRVGMAEGYPCDQADPSSMTVWTEAAVNITEAQITQTEFAHLAEGKSSEYYKLQWDRPLVFKVPHDVAPHHLRMFLEHNGRLLIPGTARFYQLYSFDIWNNYASKLQEDAEWRIPGSIHLVKCTHINKKQTRYHSKKEWTSMQHALAAILDTVNAAAKRIQSAWRRCIADPAYAVAQKRLYHEYHELQVTNATVCWQSHVTFAEMCQLQQLPFWVIRHANTDIGMHQAHNLLGRCLAQCSGFIQCSAVGC